MQKPCGSAAVDQVERRSALQLRGITADE